MDHKRLNAILAGLVFIVSWMVYFLTKAPTLSFWDCGEFVACSYSLGVPHPPGTPLFVVVGHFISMMLSFIQEKAVRITLISTTGGACTALMVYLVAIRFLILGFGEPRGFWPRLSLYAGGIVSALCTSFAATVWFNNVESEVYGANVTIMMITNWLILRWAEKRNEPGADRYIILTVFLAFLNIGLHVQALLILPSFFLYVILMDKEKLHDWRFWAMGVVLFMQAMAVNVFLWLAPVALLVTLLIMLFSTADQRKTWQLVFWMCLVAILGYSIHMYIPIRSAQDPMIDENDPETWQNFKYFLERKQYGNESMVQQMFTRHGTLRGQFYDGPNMGYGLYHLKQFHWNIRPDADLKDRQYWNPFNLSKPQEWLRLLLYLLPSALMIYGMAALYRKNREASLLFIALYLTTSLGLILYMNFKDGFIQEYPREVRERDYFFTVGFLYFMFWVGIGATALLRWFYDHKHEIVRTLAPAATILCLLIPAVPLAANYKTHNRTGDYVPWDYSYNLLMSCDREGILFTNGDNDTFPVWALQEVYGIRRDVRIVNLSLLNTNWYIEQLKTLEPKVPISFGLDEIATLEHQRNPFEKPVRYPVGKTGLMVTLPGRDTQPVLRIQDIMVMNIVESTNFKKPVYFAVTVSDDNKMGLDPYLSMEALVFKLEKQAVQGRMNVNKSIDNIINVYRYRGLGDGSCRLDDDTRRLLTNYTASFIGVALEERRIVDELKERSATLRAEADSLAKKKSPKAETGKLSADSAEAQYQAELDRVLGVLKKCTSLVPDDWRPRILLTEYLLQHERYAEAEEISAQGILVEPTQQEFHNRLALAQQKQGKQAEAIRTFRNIIAANPDFYTAYSSIADMFLAMGKTDSAVFTYEEWLRRHPGDRRAIDALSNLKKDTTHG